MTRYRAVAALTLCLLASTVAVAAQDAPPPPPAPPAKTLPTPPPPPPLPPPPLSAAVRNVQVDVSVTSGEGAAAVKKHMTVVAADGQLALGRSGIEVPVEMAPGGNITYRSVGMNVDARPRILEAGKVGVNLKLKFNTVLKAEGQQPGRPSFGNADTEMYVVLDSGKPLVMSHTADGETGRAFSVEVKATILK